MRSMATVICVSDAPDVRMTVYSEFPTSCEIANSVPINTAVGISSYTCPGRLKPTKSNARPSG